MQTHRWTQNDTEKPSDTGIMGIMAKRGDGGNHVQADTRTNKNKHRQTNRHSVSTNTQTDINQIGMIKLLQY